MTARSPHPRPFSRREKGARSPACGDSRPLPAATTESRPCPWLPRIDEARPRRAGAPWPARARARPSGPASGSDARGRASGDKPSRRRRSGGAIPRASPWPSVDSPAMLQEERGPIPMLRVIASPTLRELVSVMALAACCVLSEMSLELAPALSWDQYSPSITINNYSCKVITEITIDGHSVSTGPLDPGDSNRYPLVEKCPHNVEGEATDTNWRSNVACSYNPTVNWVYRSSDELPGDSLIVESRSDTQGGGIRITAKLDCITIEQVDR
jgi:hypothetical protein